MWDGYAMRFLLALLCPIFVAFTLFFMSIVVGAVFQLMGPVSDIRQNTRFHSAKPPTASRYPDLELPHVTVQIPIYKEGLKGYEMINLS